MKSGYSSFFFLFTALLVNSCSGNVNIGGTWKAEFSVPEKNPVQYLTVSGNMLVSDEPAEDWYGIPAEKLYLDDDSLYFERFWGLEKYSGCFNSRGEFHGYKTLRDGSVFDFTMKKTNGEIPVFKIPRLTESGKRVTSYKLRKSCRHHG